MRSDSPFAPLGKREIQMELEAYGVARPLFSQLQSLQHIASDGERLCWSESGEAAFTKLREALEEIAAWKAAMEEEVI